MQSALIVIFAGIIATAGMTITLWGITRAGFANADMVRALGSFVTRRLENALPVGLVIHFFVGIPIAIVYSFMLRLFDISSFTLMIFAGGLIGFVHGFFFSFVLLTIDEYHPLAEFQNANIEVSFAHIIGHVVYGLLVGVVIGISGA